MAQRVGVRSMTLGLVFTFALAGALTLGALVAYLQVKQGFEEQLERRLKSYAAGLAASLSPTFLDRLVAGGEAAETPARLYVRRVKEFNEQAGTRRIAVLMRDGTLVLDTAGGKIGERDYSIAQDQNELESCFDKGALTTIPYHDAQGRLYRNAFAPIIDANENKPSRFAVAVEIEADYIERLNAVGMALAACVLGVFAVTLAAALVIARLQGRLRQDLARQTRLAELAQFSAGMAHQIKNPLAAMRGYTELLARSLGDSMQKQLAEKLVAETGLLDRVVRDFLTFSRGARGSSEHLTLNALLEPTLEQARSRGGPGVAIRLVCEQPSAEVEADANAVRNALVNLTVNAAEALSERGGTVDVVATVGSKQVTVEVRDDGPGMPEEVRKRLFEPFTTGKADGTGLGLAISRRLFRDMGGDLVLMQTGPSGTIFKATFDRYWSGHAR